MSILSESEKQAFEKLANTEVKGLWALAIKNVTSSSDPMKFRRLVCDLKSQADDNPEVMKNILGEAYDSIISL